MGFDERIRPSRSRPSRGEVVAFPSPDEDEDDAFVVRWGRVAALGLLASVGLGSGVGLGIALVGLAWAAL